MKKLIDAPVKPHILKYIRREYDFDGVLDMPGRMYILRPSNPDRYRRYFEKPPRGSIWIKICTYYADIRKAYTIIRAMEREFRERMCIYTEAYVQTGMSARQAIKNYLLLYDLSDNDYKLDTAYKTWQRYIIEKDKKSRIPLWQ